MSALHGIRSAGIVLWLRVSGSGVHATIAGVLAAMTIPRLRASIPGFVSAGAGGRWTNLRRAVTRMLRTIHNPPPPNSAACIGHWKQPFTTSKRPCSGEHSLEQPVAYVIMPIFAVANAGVPFVGSLIDTLLSPVGLGIIFGLVVGQPVSCSFPDRRAGVADLPEGVTWRHIWGQSWLAASASPWRCSLSLAFDGEPALLNSAKVAILVASLISGVVGYLILRTTAPVDEMSAGPAVAVRRLPRN